MKGIVRLSVIFAGVGILSFALVGWTIHREIPFNAERWRQPNYAWDRWRMVRGLQVSLEQRQPNEEEVGKLLEGLDPAAGRMAKLTTLRKSHILVFHLGHSRAMFGSQGELRVFFNEQGRFESSEVHGE